MKVISATLHQSAPLNGGISSDKTLNGTKVPGITMELIPQGLMVGVPHKTAKGKHHMTLIPLPNCAALSLADAEEKVSKTDKK